MVVAISSANKSQDCVINNNNEHDNHFVNTTRITLIPLFITNYYGRFRQIPMQVVIVCLIKMIDSKLPLSQFCAIGGRIKMILNID